MPRTMSDKQKRAINRGRVKAGLKPIKFAPNTRTRKAQIKRLSSKSFKKTQHHMANLRKGSAGNW